MATQRPVGCGVADHAPPWGRADQQPFDPIEFVVQKVYRLLAGVLHKALSCNSYCGREATWRSGYAADCKSVYSGSIPDVASIKILGKFKNLTQDELAR